MKHLPAIFGLPWMRAAPETKIASSDLCFAAGRDSVAERALFGRGQNLSMSVVKFFACGCEKTGCETRQARKKRRKLLFSSFGTVRACRKYARRSMTTLK
jgi:hypothetical protein